MNSWKNGFTQQALDGWRINGNGSLYSGVLFTIGCAVQNAPPGYWTGTPSAQVQARRAIMSIRFKF
jgi:hypothetical protein